MAVAATRLTLEQFLPEVVPDFELSVEQLFASLF